MSRYTPIDASGTAPKRIQRRRTKGWRMPPDAIYVGRPTVWGNPFCLETAAYYRPDEEPRQCVARAFRDAMTCDSPMIPHSLVRERLRGHDLACWCRPDQPCHADTLLEIANG